MHSVIHVFNAHIGQSLSTAPRILIFTTFVQIPTSLSSLPSHIPVREIISSQSSLDISPFRPGLHEIVSQDLLNYILLFSLYRELYGLIIPLVFSTFESFYPYIQCLTKSVGAASTTPNSCSRAASVCCLLLTISITVSQISLPLAPAP